MHSTAKEKERRAHLREHEPSRQLRIFVDGEEVMTENWSMGGFCSYGLYRFDKKDRFRGLVESPDGGPKIPFTGRVMRVDHDGARIVSLVEIELDDLLALQKAAPD